MALPVSHVAFTRRLTTACFSGTFIKLDQCFHVGLYAHDIPMTSFLLSFDDCQIAEIAAKEFGASIGRQMKRNSALKKQRLISTGSRF